MKVNFRSLLSALAIFSLSVSANAAYITIDPDDYAAGEDLSNRLEGVRLMSMTRGPGSSVLLEHVIAAEDPYCAVEADDCYAVTGNQVFARVDGNMRWYDAPQARMCFESLFFYNCGAGFMALVIGFDTPTDFVELSGNYLSDGPMLWAYDSSRRLVGANVDMGPWDRDGTFYTTGVTSITSASANISYVVAAGWSAFVVARRAPLQRPRTWHRRALPAQPRRHFSCPPPSRAGSGPRLTTRARLRTRRAAPSLVHSRRRTPVALNTARPH